MIGKLIGNYQITAELAPGRLGPVYRGQSVDQTREVVIKTINLSIFPASTQVQLKARFRREVFVQRQLQHPNIVRVYDFLNFEGQHYLIQEYVPGSSLRELLQRQGLPNAAQGIFLIKQALAALDYAHRFSYLDQSDFQRTGLIHANLKPSNLLLDQRGRLHLTDFGVVNKVLTGEGRKTATTFELETIYLAPEQVRGMTPDASSDMYSLGVTFYEMLTGRVPYANLSRTDALDVRRLNGEAEAQSLTQLRPDVPPQLALVIARAIKRNPKERFVGAADFLRALRECEPQIQTGDLTLRGQTARGALKSPPPTGPLPASPPSQPMPPRQQQAGPQTGPLPNRPPQTGPLQNRPPMQPSVRPPMQMQVLPPERMSAPRQPARVEPIKRKTAAFAPQTTSALPRAIPVNVAPPLFAELSKPRRDWWLIPVAVASILVGTMTGAYFFSSPKTNENRADERATRLPALPEATPTPLLLTEAPGTLASDTALEARTLASLPAPKPAVAVPDSPLINLARVAEQQESYNEAIRAYEEFSVANPTAPFAPIARARANNLRMFQGLLANARDAFAEARYGEAQQQFAAALKLRPTSRTAQNGWHEAGAKLAATQTSPNDATAPANAGPGKGSARAPEAGAKSESQTDKGTRAEEKPLAPRSAAPKPTPPPLS